MDIDLDRNMDIDRNMDMDMDMDRNRQYIFGLDIGRRVSHAGGIQYVVETVFRFDH